MVNMADVVSVLGLPVSGTLFEGAGSGGGTARASGGRAGAGTGRTAGRSGRPDTSLANDRTPSGRLSANARRARAELRRQQELRDARNARRREARAARRAANG